MKIVRLSPGQDAPEGSDSIVLSRLPNGRCFVRGLTANRVGREAANFTISEKALRTMEEAEAAGIRWALTQPIDRLFVVYHLVD